MTAADRPISSAAEDDAVDLAQQVADLRAALDDERAARRIAGEAADRFRDVLADCLGHDDENPGDDVLVAEVRTHFGRTGPEPTRWRDFLTGARARLDQIEAMPDPLHALSGSGEQPGPLKAGVMALTGLSSDEVDALGGVREDDRPAPAVPDSTGLREVLDEWRKVVRIESPDDGVRVPVRDLAAVLAVVGQGVTAEQAWDEGWKACASAAGTASPHHNGPRNPYRAVVRSDEQGGE